MKRVKQFSIWIIALLAMTVTNYAWAADTKKPEPGGYLVSYIGGKNVYYPVAIRPTEIAVKWNPGTDNVTPQNKLRYRVAWKKKSSDSWKYSHPDNNLAVNMTSYTITGLEANTEYIVDVAVRDEAGNGIWYGEKTVKTEVAPDTQNPKSGTMTVGTVTTNSIALSWTKGTDNVTPQNKLKYKVHWKKKSDKIWQSIPYKTDITAYTITGLQPNTEYDVHVHVKDEVGYVAFYGEETVKTKAPDTQYPVAGTLTVGTVTANSIALSWTRGSDNITPQSKLKYRVLWKKKSDNNWTVSHGNDNYQVNMTSYIITGLQPDTEYDVDVAVRDEANNGVFYGERTVKTEKDTQDPKPGSYEAGYPKATGSTTIEVKWTRGSDNVTPLSKLMYRVYWKKKSSSGWESSQYTVNMTSYTITDLEPNTEYIVDVEVEDEADNRTYYGEKTVKTKQAADTQAPTPGGYETGYPKATGSTTIEVKWTKGIDKITPQNKLKYRVYWKKSPGGSWQVSHGNDNLQVDMTSYTITGLEPNTEYLVDVSIWDEAENYKYYGEKTVKTKQAADTQSPTPGTFTVGTVTTNRIALSWTKGSDNITPQNKLRYRVAWRKTSDPDIAASWKYSHPEDNPSVDITSYTITGLQPNTEYIVDVQVWDEVGRHKWYGEKTVKTKQATTPAVPVTGVTLDRNSVTIDGDYSTIQLTATVHPSNASDKSLTWASSDPTVVSVDSKGLVTIHKKGKARVTATANDGSGQSDTCLFDVIRTVANETVDGLRVYAHGSALYLTLPKAETIHIYNVGGSLVKTLALPAGDHVQPLPSGVYLVCVGEQVTKILVK